ncbi:MAG: eL32 family ribosomal protein [Candidatus Nanoarchaeia archaeon]|nr:eL32 family ribosomal protein [Candidatus Nanoarchaeia archaeon]MDD5358187.1 eL32 family ribosomal protein [Candidatus Nanoarchaeia archaeon]MDD5589453.1 eL32 family ribosomal protein [Candidatus Nanoarchaeia archaeon]
MPKFLRRNWDKYSRLGKNKKKKQVWRSPHGRHNKMRLKRKGYPATVNIGYKQEEKKRMVLVNNLKELEHLREGTTIIVGKMGAKKKMELVNKAKSKKLHLYNINVKKFMKKTEKANKEKEAEKSSEKKETHKEHEKKQENKK